MICRARRSSCRGRTGEPRAKRCSGRPQGVAHASFQTHIGQEKILILDCFGSTTPVLSKPPRLNNVRTTRDVMLQSEDKADAPQGRDGAPGRVTIRRLSARLVQILPNLVLLVLAIWPAVVLIGSVRLPEFNVSLPGLLVAFIAFVLAALFLIALQGRARKLNLTISAVACFAAFCAGELVLKWQHKSIRSIAET